MRSLGVPHFMYGQEYIYEEVDNNGAGLWLHGGERQTAFAAVPAQQVHRFLDRDGVDVREQGVDQRQ